jgi:hypothetical protein
VGDAGAIGDTSSTPDQAQGPGDAGDASSTPDQVPGPGDAGDAADAGDATDAADAGDATDAADAGDATDAAAPATLADHSFVVTANLGWTRSGPVVPDGLAKSITMTVRPFEQGGEPHLLVGVSGFFVNVRAEVLTGGSWSSLDPIYLAGEVFPDPVACVHGKSITFDSLELHGSTDAATTGALVGTATGSMVYYQTDEMQTGQFTANLSGVPDTVPPQLAGPWFTSWNPLEPVVLDVSEPLWPGAMLGLACGAIARIDLSPFPRISSNVTLAPGDTCTLAIRDLVDLAGNAATGPSPLPPFMVLDPGVFPQDGFESGQGGTLEGNAELTMDASRIAGQQSLRLFGAPHGVGRFTARLVVPTGATKVLATLVEAPNFLGTRQQVQVDLGFSGSPSLSLHPLPGATVAEGAQAWPLPAGDGPEVLFRISTSGCELGAPVVILDDLRVE